MASNGKPFFTFQFIIKMEYDQCEEKQTNTVTKIQYANMHRHRSTIHWNCSVMAERAKIFQSFFIDDFSWREYYLVFWNLIVGYIELYAIVHSLHSIHLMATSSMPVCLITNVFIVLNNAHKMKHKKRVEMKRIYWIVWIERCARMLSMLKELMRLWSHYIHLFIDSAISLYLFIFYSKVIHHCTEAA